MNTRTLALLTLVAATAPALADPLAGNGGFEMPGANATLPALWTPNAGGAPGTLSQRDSSTPFAGQWAQRLVAIGNNTVGASAGVTQNSADVGLASLAPGSSLTLSFQGNYNFGPGGVGFYAVRVLNSTGEIVANTGLQVVTNSTNGYQLFTSPTLTVPAFGASPNDSYFAFAEFSVAAGAFDGSSARAFIDNVDISGTTVPAPASLALLGGGLIIAGRRRRA